jgi:D-lactate dehydrogenase
MKVAVFSAKPYDRQFLAQVNQKYGHELKFLDAGLDAQTASLASGFEAVCVFVNDRLDRQTIEILSNQGVKLIALRCAGYNNIDLDAAEEFGLAVVRVPAYSPFCLILQRSP